MATVLTLPQSPKGRRPGTGRTRHRAAPPTQPGGSPPGAPPAAAALLRQLEPRIDHIAQTMLGFIRQEFVEQQQVDDVEGELAAVRSIVSTFVTCASENRPIALDERERFVSIGAEAMRQGVTLPTLLDSIRLGARIGWLCAGEEAHAMRPESLAVSALEEFGLLVFNFTTELCDLVTIGYASTQGRRARARSGPAEALMDELLRGSLRSPDDLRRRGRELGFNPDSLFGLTVVAGAGEAAAGPEILAAADAALRAVPRGGVTVMIDGALPHAVMVVPLPDQRSWRRFVGGFEAATAGLPVRLLSAPVVPALLAIPQAYRRLRRLIRLARGHSGGHSLWESDLAVAGLLGELGTEDRDHFLDLLLGPVRSLPAHRRAPLLDGLRAFIEAGSVATRAAQRLHVHPKTLRYRLRRVQDLTGIDPFAPGDRFRLELALRLSELSTTGRGGS
ncbi:MAG: PucR family transcriptional regulator [Candidatus Dormibacteria bacterium]